MSFSLSKRGRVQSDMEYVKSTCRINAYRLCGKGSFI